MITLPISVPLERHLWWRQCQPRWSMPELQQDFSLVPVELVHLFCQRNAVVVYGVSARTMRIQYHSVAHGARLVYWLKHSCSRWWVSTIKNPPWGKLSVCKKVNFNRTCQLPAHRKKIICSVLSDQTGLFHHLDAFLHTRDHQEPQKSHYYLAQDPGSDTAQEGNSDSVGTKKSQVLLTLTLHWWWCGATALPQQQTGAAPRGAISTLDWP